MARLDIYAEYKNKKAPDEAFMWIWNFNQCQGLKTMQCHSAMTVWITEPENN